MVERSIKHTSLLQCSLLYVTRLFPSSSGNVDTYGSHFPVKNLYLTGFISGVLGDREGK